jgi:hypothetical protein
VQETSSKSREHRLRVLEHQARMATERSVLERTDAQGRIPLLIEVKPGTVEKLPRARRARHKTHAKQAGFEGL